MTHWNLHVLQWVGVHFLFLCLLFCLLWWETFLSRKNTKLWNGLVKMLHGSSSKSTTRFLFLDGIGRERYKILSYSFSTSKVRSRICSISGGPPPPNLTCVNCSWGFCRRLVWYVLLTLHFLAKIQDDNVRVVTNNWFRQILVKFLERSWLKVAIVNF